MNTNATIAVSIMIGALFGWGLTRAADHHAGESKAMQQIPAAKSPDGMPTRRVIVSTARTTDLAAVCRGQHSGTELDGCNGFIMGAYDAASVDGAICPLESTDTMQVLAVGRTALTADAAAAQTPSAVLGSAFRKAWPCGKGANG